MRKFIAIGSAAIMAVALAAAPSTAVAHPTRAATHAATTQHAVPLPGQSTITWHKCSEPGYTMAGFQCSSLTVPLDYAKPHGAKIKLAISRIKHTSSAADYKGVMLGNFGGPGGASLVFPILTYYVPNGVGADYDWVGFDPRGVGHSTALSCDSSFFHGNRTPYRPTKPGYMKQWVKRSKAYAAACTKAKNSALFNHVKTVDNVRDMESLREALGVGKISFYGFSYGTYIGQVYATLHPGRVRHLILDSSVDPKTAFYGSNQAQDIAFQKTFNIYFHWLAKYWKVYHVGKTFKGVQSRWIATRKKLDTKAAGGVLGGDELIDVFTSAGYYVFGWEGIAKAYSTYLHTGNAKPLINMYTSANPTTKGGDNGYAIYLGTQCTDAHWPQSQAKLNSDNRELDKKHFYFTWSNAWFNGPCAYWHYQPRKRVVVDGSRLKVPVLMFDETYDAATPFPGNLVVRKLFPTASLIEGKDGSTHAGTLNGDTCDDNAIARYLGTGALPTRKKHYGSDKVCPPLPQPDPTASAAAASSSAHSAAITAVHRQLEEQLLRSAMMAH